MPGHHPNASSLTNVSRSTIMYLLYVYKHHLLCLTEWMDLTSQLFLTPKAIHALCYLSIQDLAPSLWCNTVLRKGKTKWCRLSSSFLRSFALFDEICPKGPFYVAVIQHSAFLVSHKPSDTGGELWVGVFWPVGIWQWFADPVQLLDGSHPLRPWGRMQASQSLPLSTLLWTIIGQCVSRHPCLSTDSRHNQLCFPFTIPIRTEIQ